MMIVCTACQKWQHKNILPKLSIRISGLTGSGKSILLLRAVDARISGFDAEFTELTIGFGEH
jgi:hypothetical protein